MKKSLLLGIVAVFATISVFGTQRLVSDPNDLLSPGTFRFEADNSVAGDTIIFDPATDTIILNLAELAFDNDLVIIGYGDNSF